MAKHWRHAIVGCGSVGDWHVKVIPSLASSEIVAICDVDVPKTRAYLEKMNLTHLPLYADLREMLAKEKIDVAHVATPSGDHRDPVITCLEAGVPTICEKPLEINLERIDAMIEASRRSGTKLAGIFQNRWNLANRAIHDAAAEGRFGRVAWVGSFTPWYRSDQYYRDAGWRGTWKLDGGGAIMNQSVHAVDLLQWIAGPVKTVTAFASSRIHAEIEVEDTLTCALELESGAFGTIMGSTAMFPGGQVRIEIGGEFGHAVSQQGLQTYRFKDERPTDKETIETANAKRPAAAGGSGIQQGLELHQKNISAILESWERGEEAETNGVEARKAVAIIVAMYESARKKGRPVDVR